jgi:O-antigen ligase
MLSKKDIVNFLFIISFPVHGIGSFLSTKSPTLGFIISVLPMFAILLFYVVDMLYKKEFRVRLNGYYFLAVIFLVSSAMALYVALTKNLPETNSWQVFGKILLIFIPFHAFIVVHLYNEGNKNSIPKLLFISLSVLLFINLVGFFVLGMQNERHSLEGRINFPYLAGVYSGASMLAIINLMLLFFTEKLTENPVRFFLAAGFFLMNMALLFFINSRLVILIFLMVLVLFLFRIPKKVKGFYLLAFLTLPLLESMGIIIYKILSLPLFASILQRVDIVDVTTFNGRLFLWEDGFNWLLIDQRGLLFGNGYKGHYFLHLIDDVAMLWHESRIHHLHMHSTVLELVIGQGIFGLLIFMLLFYVTAKYYRKEYQRNTREGTFFAITIFLLFIMQVDLFVYWDSLGFIIFSLLLAKVVLTRQNLMEQKGIPIELPSLSLSY